MQIFFYPDKSAFQKAKEQDDPVLLMISFDGSEALVANIDDVMEHSILLRKLDRSAGTIDRYFRFVVNRSGADWTFACPADYKKIADRTKRIEHFYGDGIEIADRVLKKLGYEVLVNIPERYRRHFNELRN